MAKTASGLVAYAIGQLGRPYWYATYGQVSSYDLYVRKKQQYPKYYTATDFASQYGKIVHDCVGMIKGYMWSDGTPDGKPTYNSNGFPDVSANGLYSYCKTKGKIDTMPDVPGVCVFFSGHVGIYIGNGEVVEARGHAYGVVKTKLKNRGWTHWGAVPGVDYNEIPVPDQPEPEKPKSIKRGDKGDLVKKLQTLLIEIGYALPVYGVDGDFGEETESAVKLFQKCEGLEATGVVDQQTADLILAKASEDDADDEDTSETVRIFMPGTWNIRNGAGTTFDVVGYAKFGDEFEYIATATNGWISIRTKNGKAGWVSPKCAEVK